METKQIVTWIRDQAIRAPEDVLKRGMIQAADALEMLEKRNSVASAQAVCFAEDNDRLRDRVAQLEAELKAEMHRHDRLQDFEVAEAQELARLKTENAAMAAELKKAGVCDVCKNGKVNYLEEPCFSCMQDPTSYPGWEWKGQPAEKTNVN